MFFKSINSKRDQPTVPYISHCFLRFQAGSRTSQSQPWQLLGGGLVAAMPQKSPKPPAARRVCRLNTVHRGSSMCRNLESQEQDRISTITRKCQLCIPSVYIYIWSYYTCIYIYIIILYIYMYMYISPGYICWNLALPNFAAVNVD